ncbi:lipase family protein [Verrucomicrobiota bacterium sgz303538]
MSEGTVKRADDHKCALMWRFAAFAAAILPLAGCASVSKNSTARPKTVAGSESVERLDRKGWKRNQMTYDNHPSGASVEVRETARKTYLFAQLAQNAYGPFDAKDGTPKTKPDVVPKEYKLPSYVSERKPMEDDSRTGFAARIYDVRKPGSEPFVVVAFRGTNFTSWPDWVYGNLPVNDSQYKQGLEVVRREKRRNPGTRMVVTGHSLGGAIATYVSLREPNVPAFGFNASHRLTAGLGLPNERYMVSQYGEIGVLFRRVFINASGTYTTINCVHGNALDRHTMTYLADCLTRIAAASGDQAAQTSVKLNSIVGNERILR